MTWLITYASNIPAAPSRLHGGERKSCLCCRDIRSIADFLNRRPLLAYKQSCIRYYVLRVSRRIVMRSLLRRRLEIKNCRRWHFMILYNDAQITGSFLLLEQSIYALPLQAARLLTSQNRDAR